jgi:thymidine phosphorylase
VGVGAFMQRIDEARDLARMMVDIGTSAGRTMVALLSDMNQPLGAAVGNALEVREAIETLRGAGPADLREHCLGIGGHMVRLGRQDNSEYALAEAMAELADLIDSGRGLAKLRELVAAQGGDVRVIDDPERLPQARIKEEIAAPREGFVGQLNALLVAQASLELGAGRARKTDSIDPAVGVVVHRKVGERVAKGDKMFTIHANDETKLAQARELLHQAPDYRDREQQPLPTFYDTIYGDQ